MGKYTFAVEIALGKSHCAAEPAAMPPAVGSTTPPTK